VVRQHQVFSQKLLTIKKGFRDFGNGLENERFMLKMRAFFWIISSSIRMKMDLCHSVPEIIIHKLTLITTKDI
jgi:hypothetical protein